MFNSPHINEMMARETMEYRAAEFEDARRRQRARAARDASRAGGAPKPTRPRLSTLLRRAARRPA